MITQLPSYAVWIMMAMNTIHAKCGCLPLTSLREVYPPAPEPVRGADRGQARLHPLPELEARPRRGGQVLVQLAGQGEAAVAEEDGVLKVVLLLVLIVH